MKALLFLLIFVISCCYCTFNSHQFPHNRLSIVQNNSGENCTSTSNNNNCGKGPTTLKNDQQQVLNNENNNLFFKTVHILPHSHWDVGWLTTKQKYYEEQVKPIIKSVLKALSQDSNRKFTFVEMSFIEQWFITDASKQERQLFMKLLKNSQIELSLAGMTMSDEATNTYSSIIHTLTRGHQFVNDFLNEKEENYLPTNAFRIDPFGTTSTLTRIYKESGLLDQIVMRIPHEVQEKLRWEKRLAFLWKLMDGSVAYSQVLDYQYCIPHFFDHSHPFSFAEDQIAANVLHQEILKYSLGFRNLTASAKWIENEELIEEIKMGSQDILLPAGCDFSYRDASPRFRRLENAMRFINENPQIYPYKVRFSTLNEYFQATKPKEWKDSYSNLKNPKNLKFSPTFDGEFMPYSDNSDSYWTGFFTSYPILKQAIRKGEAHLRNVKTLLALSSPLRNYSIVEDLKTLDELTVVVADLTHHDAITGTSKSFVNDDYLNQLEQAIEKSKVVVVNSLSSLLTHSEYQKKEELRIKLDYSVEEMLEKESSVVIYNSLSWKLTNYVIEMGAKDQVDKVCAFYKNKRLSVQYVPSLMNKDGFDLHILIPTIPALGFTTIVIKRCEISSKNSIETIDKNSTIETLTTSSNSSVSLCKNHGDEKNATTTLCSINLMKNNQKYEISHRLMRYFGIETKSMDEQNSGAYIFRPQSSYPELLEQDDSSGSDQPIVKIHSMKDTNMQLFTQFEQRINNYATSVVRIYNADIAEHQGYDLEYLFKIGELPTNEEVIVRFNASSFINSHREFYCDRNGLETTKFRSRRNAQSSYLPIVYNCFIRDRRSQTRLTLFVSETHGATSLNNGELEVMLHRRTLKDDTRGVAEKLNDHSTVLVNIKVRVDQDQHWNEENVRRGILHAKESLTNHFKPLIVSVDHHVGNLTSEFSGISQESKCIHLSNFEMIMNRKLKSEPRLLIQLQHLGFSNCETKYEEYPVKLEKIFANGLLKGCSMNETNLSGSRIVSSSRITTTTNSSGGDGGDDIPSEDSTINVYLSPYTFKTFLVEPTTQYGLSQQDQEYDGKYERKVDSFWGKLHLTLSIIFTLLVFACIPVLKYQYY